jgi:hypothetical protein
VISNNVISDSAPELTAHQPAILSLNVYLAELNEVVLEEDLTPEKMHISADYTADNSAARVHISVGVSSEDHARVSGFGTPADTAIAASG